MKYSFIPIFLFFLLNGCGVIWKGVTLNPEITDSSASWTVKGEDRKYGIYECEKYQVIVSTIELEGKPIAIGPIIPIIPTPYGETKYRTNQPVEIHVTFSQELDSNIDFTSVNIETKDESDQILKTQSFEKSSKGWEGKFNTYFTYVYYVDTINNESIVLNIDNLPINCEPAKIRLTKEWYKFYYVGSSF